MLSYRYMEMRMDGNQDGTDSVGDREVLNDFMVTPTDMDMRMHMVGGMYAPSDDVTLMAMVPWIDNSMDHRTRAGGRFETNTAGLGDVGLSGLIVLTRGERQRVHLNAGFSVPTGSINEKDTTPMGRSTLPYPMQLGSGTVDVLPGITYLGQSDDWSWGGQLMWTQRIGKNSAGYALGNRARLTGWGARRLSDSLSASVRLAADSWGNIRGDDDDLNPAVVPTADPDRRAGRRLDASIGMNYYGRNGLWQGQRLAFELGAPVYQDLDGPQLATDWFFTVGWQYAW